VGSKEGGWNTGKWGLDVVVGRRALKAEKINKEKRTTEDRFLLKERNTITSMKQQNKTKKKHQTGKEKG